MRRVSIRHAALFVVACTLVAPSAALAGGPASPGVLKGHVSFLASDTLEGRSTPSIGLDVAAEYIAAQYRRIGLEPVGDDGYFQTAPWEERYREAGDLRVVLGAGPGAAEIPERQLSVIAANDGVELDRAAIETLDFEDPVFDGEEGSWSDRVIVSRVPEMSSVPREERRAFFGKWQAFGRAVQRSGARVVLSAAPDAPASEGVAGPVPRRSMGLPGAALLRVHGAAAQGLLDAGDEQVSVSLAPPRERSVPVRNVVGLLRGSDPDLAAEHVIVSAHYDHVGAGGEGEDRIYNGANDNASGVAGVIEIASLLASGEAPKRSVLFICYYGEEMGLVGARRYAETPLLPLEDAIANINLEQIGRTDDASGDIERRILPTGMGYSTALAPIMAAAEEHGVETTRLEEETVRYFRASDNAALAAKGVPAHTICTAFSFPGYHDVDDHWDRLDYENMALVVRAVAEGVRRLADAEDRPEWIPSDATTPFIEAREGD